MKRWVLTMYNRGCHEVQLPLFSQQQRICPSDGVQGASGWPSDCSLDIILHSVPSSHAFMQGVMRTEPCIQSCNVETWTSSTKIQWIGWFQRHQESVFPEVKTGFERRIHFWWMEIIWWKVKRQALCRQERNPNYQGPREREAGERGGRKNCF